MKTVLAARMSDSRFSGTSTTISVSAVCARLRNSLAGSHDLAHLHGRRGDDPIRVGAERCVIELVARQCELPLRLGQSCVRHVHGGLALVVFGGQEGRRHPAEPVVPLEIHRRIARVGCSGRQYLLIRLKSETQIRGIQPSERLPSRYVVPDIHEAFDYLAPDAETEIGKDARLHCAGIANRTFPSGQFDRLHTDRTRGPRLPDLGRRPLASSQQSNG